LSIIYDSISPLLMRTAYQPTTQAKRFTSPYSFSPEEINDVILMVKQSGDRDGYVLRQMKDTLDSLNDAKFSKLSYSSISKYNEPLEDEINVAPAEFEDHKAKNDLSYFEEIKSKFVGAYHEQISQRQAKQDEFKQKFATAEKKIAETLKIFGDLHSIFRVYAVLNNPGGSEVSVKRPALLRVYIGPGNYVDLKLLTSDEKQALDVPPHGSRTVTLISSEVGLLPAEDQKLISQYWGQSVSAILFVEDTFGIVRTSNRIPFVESAYQKIVYDRLAGEAAKPIHFGQ
jgi:hypothetical protein